MAEDEKWEYYFDDVVDGISRISLSGKRNQLFAVKSRRWKDCDARFAWDIDCRHITREEAVEYAKEYYGVDLPE